MLKFLVLIILMSAGCTKEITPPYKVLVNTDNLTLNPDKLTFNYQVQGDPCDMSWHVVKNKDKPEWGLKLRINSDYKCKSFSEEKNKHSAVLTKIFKEHNKFYLKHVRTPSLSTIQRDKSWNHRLSIASGLSNVWKDYFLNYPHNKSRLNSNGVLVKIMKQQNINKEFTNLFLPFQIKLSLNHVEKVLSKKSDSTYYKKIPTKKALPSRVLFDASTFWYELK